MSVARVGIRGFHRVDTESYHAKAVMYAGAGAAGANKDLAGKALQMLEGYKKRKLAPDPETLGILRAVEMVLFKYYRSSTKTIMEAINLAVENADCVADIVAAIRGAGGPETWADRAALVLEFKFPAAG